MCFLILTRTCVLLFKLEEEKITSIKFFKLEYFNFTKCMM